MQDLAKKVSNLCAKVSKWKLHLGSELLPTASTAQSKTNLSELGAAPKQALVKPNDATARNNEAFRKVANLEEPVSGFPGEVIQY